MNYETKKKKKDVKYNENGEIITTEPVTDKNGEAVTEEAATDENGNLIEEETTEENSEED